MYLILYSHIFVKSRGNLYKKYVVFLYNTTAAKKPSRIKKVWEGSRLASQVSGETFFKKLQSIKRNKVRLKFFVQTISAVPCFSFFVQKGFWEGAGPLFPQKRVPAKTQNSTAPSKMESSTSEREKMDFGPGSRLIHMPSVKSGMATVALPMEMDSSDRRATAMRVAES